MIVRATNLPGVLLIEPRVFHDERGYFLESFNAGRYAAHENMGLPTAVVQTNHSRSRRGVLRGLHFQRRKPQGKLVSVARGRIFDVAVDLRPGSATFGRWTGVLLDDEAPRQIWIPAGFAHGFCVLSDVADVTYACTALYAPDDDLGIRWDDPTIGVQWPIASPLVSPKDAALPTLEAAMALPERPA